MPKGWGGGAEPLRASAQTCPSFPGEERGPSSRPPQGRTESLHLSLGGPRPRPCERKQTRPGARGSCRSLSCAHKRPLPGERGARGLEPPRGAAPQGDRVRFRGTEGHHQRPPPGTGCTQGRPRRQTPTARVSAFPTSQPEQLCAPVPLLLRPEFGRTERKLGL